MAYLSYPYGDAEVYPFAGLLADILASERTPQNVGRGRGDGPSRADGTPLSGLDGRRKGGVSVVSPLSTIKQVLEILTLTPLHSDPDADQAIQVDMAIDVMTALLKQEFPLDPELAEGRKKRELCPTGA